MPPTRPSLMFDSALSLPVIGISLATLRDRGIERIIISGWRRSGGLSNALPFWFVIQPQTSDLRALQRNFNMFVPCDYRSSKHAWALRRHLQPSASRSHHKLADAAMLRIFIAFNLLHYDMMISKIAVNAVMFYETISTPTLVYLAHCLAWDTLDQVFIGR